MNSTAIRLLLIEDNPGDAFLLREELATVSESSIDVVHAESLAKGLRLVCEQPIDAVLLDLTLPDSCGIATLERAGAACGHLPILVLTGLDTKSSGIEAVRMGAQDYLVKGKTTPELLSRSIRYAIERKASQRILQEARDQLEQKVRERTAELEQLNQVLRMVSDCNQALVRAKDEATLLREICEIIVRVGRYRMAWVGFVEPDRNSVGFTASGGFEAGGSENAKARVDVERGRGPTGTAIRTGQISIGGDFLIGPELSPRRESGPRRDFRSAIALPMISAGRTLGALTIYAAHPGAFDEKQIEVLKELADDLAFGIVAARTQSALRRVEHEVLEATEREQQRIGRDLHDGLQGGLAGIAMMLGSLKLGLTRTPPDKVKLMADMDWGIHAVKEALDQTRALVRGLCPRELRDDGLMKALHHLAATTSDLFGVDCRFRCERPVRIDDETIATQIYRICQEAVNNALKHSKAKSFVVALNRGKEGLTLEVRDDGVGLPDDACVRGGLGMGTMEYRARMIGASLVIRRRDEGGTIVHCSVRDTAAPALQLVR